MAGYRKICARSLCGIIFMVLLVSCQKKMPDESTKNAMDHQGISTSRGISKDELVAVLESKDFDRTISLMNQIKRTRYQGDLLPLLVDIWNSNFEDFPMIDKAFVSHPRVRLEIADILIQAGKNGALHPNDGVKYAAYARSLVKAVDPDVARQAILVIGVVNEPADVELLTNILKKEEVATFRAATLALVMNCAVDKKLVNGIAADLRRRDFATDLLKSWDNIAEMRMHVCH